MSHVFSENDFEMTTAEDEEPVKAFTADGADKALGGGELGVAISDQELDRRRPFRKVIPEVAGLLGDPACDGISRHPGEVDPAGAVVDEEQHAEAPEQDRVDAEEVAGDQALGLARRNSAQVGPDRLGAGSMPRRFRIAQTLEGASTTPMVASSPQLRR